MESFASPYVTLAISAVSLVIALGAMLFQAKAAKYQALSARDAANALTVSHLFKITSDYDELSRQIAASPNDTERAINIHKTLNFLNSLALLLEKGLIPSTIRPEIESLLLDALAVASVTGVFAALIERAVKVDASSFAQLRRFESQSRERISSREQVIRRMVSATAASS